MNQQAPEAQRAANIGSGIEVATTSYRGKRFSMPLFGPEGFEIVADAQKNQAPIPSPDASPIIACLNTIWDFGQFMAPRIPVSLGMLNEEELAIFGTPGATRVLDMPIKFPGSNFKIPKALEQFRGAIERIANFEAAANHECFDEYYCYLTVDQGTVKPDTLQREAPCHVDGFQGARWVEKERVNHSYVVSDALPTTYYPQEFDLSRLDVAKHNFYWEMNRIVAETKSASAWRPKNGEINLIDGYTVHRGSEAAEETYRTWIRLSFETRRFDRLGNAKNPLFKYDWEMVPRDIEGLDLVAFDESSDASLRVFPWQREDGQAHEDPEENTKPRLG